MPIVTKSSCCFWKCSRNSRQFLFYNCLLEILSLLLGPHRHLLLGAMKSVGQWQLVTGIHDEGGGLIPFESHSQGYVHTHSWCFSFGLTVCAHMVIVNHYFGAFSAISYMYCLIAWLNFETLLVFLYGNWQLTN